ncbi:MAG: NlpC/P60 family protein [Thermoleophilia bacterium]
MGGQSASAEPPAITRAKSEAAALQARIDELADRLDSAVEDYNYARSRLNDTKAAAKQNQTKLSAAEKDLDTACERLTTRVVDIYKQGQLGVVEALVGADSFSEVVNRLDTLRRISEQDNKMVEDVGRFRGEVERRGTELAAQLAEQKVLAAETQAAKVKVERQLAANEKALAGKEAQIAQLQREEAARQARLAAAAREAARKAAAERAAARSTSPASQNSERGSSVSSSASASSGSSAGSGSLSSNRLSSPVKVKAPAPTSAVGSSVVSIAMRYLGTPYVWAGSSPSGFDCSGFVMYVYAKVGVSLPHSSRMQYGCGTPVSRSNLQPGDLVFFYNPIHHVGIYIGGGQMIHAAGTGKDVRISAVWGSTYYGACRI